MADFYVCADGGSESEVEPVAKAIESAGATVERGSEHSNHEAIRNSGKVKPPTKLVFIESEKILTTKLVLLTNTVLSFTITSSFLSEGVIPFEQLKKSKKIKLKNQ